MRIVSRRSWIFLGILGVGLVLGCGGRVRQIQQGIKDVDAHAREIERQAQPPNAGGQNQAASK